MKNMSYQEKSLYLQLACLLALFAFYAHALVHSPHGGHWLHAVFLTILLVVGLFRLASLRSSGNTLTDERDRAILGLGARWSSAVFYAGTALLMVLYWDHGSLHSPQQLINALAHILLFAAAASIIRRMVAYRRAL